VKVADLKYVARAKKAGARYAWRIVSEARRNSVSLALAFALVEQESRFENVYGHDAVRNPIKSPPGGLKKVTRKNYAEYLHYRKAGFGMQGVGPCQLTWWEFQDRADKLGGCWLPSRNIRVGLEVLASNILEHGRHTGIARYNGTGSAAENYARSVESKQRRWHTILTGKS
jgi:hypothetical protein